MNPQEDNGTFCTRPLFIAKMIDMRHAICSTRLPLFSLPRFILSALLAFVALLCAPSFASAAISTGGATCTGNSKTAGTSLACTVATENFDVGNVAVLLFAGDNTATVNGNDGLLSSVSDSGGNTWRVARCFTNSRGSAAGGATVCVATAKIATALTSGVSTITANFSSIIAKGFVVREFTVGSGNEISLAHWSDLAATAADPASMSLSTFQSEFLLVRAVALERATGGHMDSDDQLQYNGMHGDDRQSCCGQHGDLR